MHDIEQGIQGTGHQGRLHQVRRRRAGRHPTSRRSTARPRGRRMQTGRPIMAHSHPASDTGPRADATSSLEEGVDPSKVQIAHTGDTDDLDYIERLLDTGCWIGMDRYGLDIFLPTEQAPGDRARAAREGPRRPHVPLAGLLLDARLVHAGGRGAGEPVAAPNWSMTLLFEQVIPELKERGMTEEQLDQMMVENPKGWLA